MGGRSEVRLILALMSTAAVLSCFMNTMAIVALFLPAVMDIARRTGLAPSRLLMPLTFGALLGGLTTMFATPPNLLASTALKDAGLQPFGVFDFLPVYVAALAGAALTVLGGCLRLDEAYAAVQWKALILIGGMLPLAGALDQTGAAAMLAGELMGAIAGAGPLLVLASLFVITALAACVMPRAALVVLLAPIALKTATECGLSPHAAMMTVALAAAGGFNSPVSHPSNVLIMGPGGYRFVDFLKEGIPLTLVVLVVVLLVLPWFWPLSVP